MRKRNWKALFFGIAFGSLVACASNTNEDMEDSSEGLKDELVIWIHEPTLALEGVQELKSHSYNLGIGSTFNEQIGYPQHWDSELYYDKSIDVQADVYTADSIIVKKDGKYGIYDFEGNPLLEAVYDGNHEDASQSPFEYYALHGFGISAMLDTYYYSVPILTSDFRSYSFESVGGLGGDYGFGYAQVDGEIVYIFDTFSKQELNCKGFACLVRIVDKEQCDGCKFQIGWAIYDKNSKYVADSPDFDSSSLVKGSFVNGFYGLQDNQNGLIAIVDASTGKKLTNYEFEEIKFFEEGYCPVKKNGKWAYIDTNGKAVTDYIFDDASTVYDGKVYVGIGAKQYGILDLKATLSQKIAINADTIN